MRRIVRSAVMRSRANSEYYAQKETKRMNIRHVKPKRAGVKQVLVHFKGRFYLVSENIKKKQTYIFHSSPVGEPESYLEVGGDENTTLEDVLGDFESYLFKRT